MMKNLLILLALVLSIGQMRAEKIDLAGKTLEDFTFKQNLDNLVYTGSPIVLELLKVGGDMAVAEDLVIVCADNTNAGEATVTIAARTEGDANENYEGSTDLTFTINQAELTVDNFKMTGEGSKTYSGEAIDLPTFTGKFAEENDLNDLIKAAWATAEGEPVEGTTVTDAGVYTATLTLEGEGSANFSISSDITFEFTVEPKEITGDITFDPESESEEFSGEAIEVTVSAEGLEEGTDYEVEVDGTPFAEVEIINAGEYAFVVTGKGNYTGTLEGTYKVKAKDIKEANFSDQITIDEAGYPYAGGEGVTIPDLPATLKLGDLTLTEGTDFEYKYAENTKPTEAAKLTITGIEGSNFTGTSNTEITFKITAGDFADIVVTSPVTYTGSVIAPEVTLNGGVLKAGTDYTITVAEDKTIENAGEYILTVTPVEEGVYDGQDAVEEISFTVSKANLKDVIFTPFKKDYTGEAIEIGTSDIEGELGEEYTLGTTDYAIGAVTGKDAGTATVKLTADGDNFTGEQEVEFTIIKSFLTEKEYADDIAIRILNQVFKNEPVTLTATAALVMDNGKRLVEGQDYSIAFKDYVDNDAIGEASVDVTITGKGAYAGERTVTVKFNIVAAPTYNTVKLDIAGGIDVVGYTSGSHTVESDGYLYLQFNAETASGVVVLEVDGEVVEYTNNTSGYSTYILSMDGKDRSVKMYLKAYPVAFPAYEGVTFEGEGTAEYGKPYTFGFTLADDIDPASIKVYVNDVLVEPTALRATSYTVTIDKVTGPINIRIEGLGTVGIGSISENKVYSQNGALVVETVSPQKVQVYNMTGKQQFARTVNGQEVISLSKGIYIVRLGEEVLKVVVQ